MKIFVISTFIATVLAASSASANNAAQSPLSSTAADASTAKDNASDNNSGSGTVIETLGPFGAQMRAILNVAALANQNTAKSQQVTRIIEQFRHLLSSNSDVNGDAAQDEKKNDDSPVTKSQALKKDIRKDPKKQQQPIVPKVKFPSFSSKRHPAKLVINPPVNPIRPSPAKSANASHSSDAKLPEKGMLEKVKAKQREFFKLQEELKKKVISPADHPAPSNQPSPIVSGAHASYLVTPPPTNSSKNNETAPTIEKAVDHAPTTADQQVDSPKPLPKPDATHSALPSVHHPMHPPISFHWIPLHSQQNPNSASTSTSTSHASSPIQNIQQMIAFAQMHAFAQLRAMAAFQQQQQQQIQRDISPFHHRRPHHKHSHHHRHHKDKHAKTVEEEKGALAQKIAVHGEKAADTSNSTPVKSFPLNMRAIRVVKLVRVNGRFVPVFAAHQQETASNQFPQSAAPTDRVDGATFIAGYTSSAKNFLNKAHRTATSFLATQSIPARLAISFGLGIAATATLFILAKLLAFLFHGTEHASVVSIPGEDEEKGLPLKKLKEKKGYMLVPIQEETDSAVAEADGATETHPLVPAPPPLSVSVVPYTGVVTGSSLV